MQIRKEVQAVIYNRFAESTRVLLVKKMDLKNYSYRWRLLKGGIEEGETEEQALEREIMEEVGIRDIKIEEKVQEYDYDFDGTLHQISTYIVKVMTNTPMKIQTDEIMDAQWVPKDQTVGLLFWKPEKDAVSKLKA